MGERRRIAGRRRARQPHRRRGDSIRRCKGAERRSVRRLRSDRQAANLQRAAALQAVTARASLATRSAQWVSRGSSFEPQWPGNSLESICDQLADAAVLLLRSSSVARVGSCAGCGWLFLDTSRAHARRWCSMNVCGVRDKMRRYHQRQSNATRHRVSGAGVAVECAFRRARTRKGRLFATIAAIAVGIAGIVAGSRCRNGRRRPGPAAWRRRSRAHSASLHGEHFAGPLADGRPAWRAQRHDRRSTSTTPGSAPFCARSSTGLWLPATVALCVSPASTMFAKRHTLINGVMADALRCEIDARSWQSSPSTER